jgi:hypothetical protein
MLAASVERIERDLGADDLVLDVGGWANPLARADWVIDLMPYETRGLYGEPRPEAERFTAETWVTRDICDRRPWPFADDQFVFAVCSHTLEDVRDPVWVCSELARVALAGYVEVPSRLEEQAYGVHGPWVGWSHHRWLCDVSGSGIDFVFKPGVLQGREDFQLPVGAAAGLSAAERVQTLWWEGGFEARERVFLEADELDEYLAGAVRGRRQVSPPARPRRRLRSRLRRG